MATTTQYNPNMDFNRILLEAGLSKTVYALVTPEVENLKKSVFSNAAESLLTDCREAWTGKQDALHEEFFSTWVKWSKDVVEFDRSLFPFAYPTSGASEALRQIIFSFAATPSDYHKRIHAFMGEYEGYKAMAEAANVVFLEHEQGDVWNIPHGKSKTLIRHWFNPGDLFFISAPSAIDGNVWDEFNMFLDTMPENSVIVDATYVGAVMMDGREKFNLNHTSIAAVVFSLSKPFGVYYDRIGGVFMKEENLALFGNKWFKSLYALKVGTELMKAYDVFYMPSTYKEQQKVMVEKASATLDIELNPSDVFLLAHGEPLVGETELSKYVTRAGNIRVCLTPGLAEMIGTTGPAR